MPMRRFPANTAASPMPELIRDRRPGTALFAMAACADAMRSELLVEHVHVHAGGQAIVGNVGTPGGGVQSKSEKQPDAKQITHDLSKRCGARTKSSGKPCQSPSIKNGRCRMHGGKSPGAPSDNRNALKRALHERCHFFAQRIIRAAALH